MNSPTPFTPQANFDIGALYAGQYLKADDLNGKTYLATIAAVERVDIPEQDGSVRPKAALTLQSWPAKLLLNRTNFEAIAGAYGRQSAGWLGKPIEVYPDTTLFGGRSVPCVRVRVPRPAAPTAFPTSAPSDAAPAPALAANAPPAVAPAAASAPFSTAPAIAYDVPQ